MGQTDEIKRIESKLDVKTFIDRIHYSISSKKFHLNFQIDRFVDSDRNSRYTNRGTINLLFPNDDVYEVLKNEILTLELKNYLSTVKDLRFPNRSELRVFAKKYDDYVYIKIRVELASKLAYGNDLIYILSFHYSDIVLKEKDFPYYLE